MRRNGEENPLWGGSGFCGAPVRRVNRTTQLVGWRRSPYRSDGGWRPREVRAGPKLRGLEVELQPVSQASHQVHAFVKDRHNQRRGVFAWQAEDVVVCTVRHPQRRVERAKLPERSFALCEARNAAFQVCDVPAHLRFAPALHRVADDPTQIGLRRLG